MFVLPKGAWTIYALYLTLSSSVFYCTFFLALKTLRKSDSIRLRMSSSINPAADREINCLDNPVKNLIDLLFYMSKYFKTEYRQNGDSYFLEIGSLSIEAERRTQAEKISEMIRIRKFWPDSSYEIYIYCLETVEWDFWQEKMRTKMKTTDEGDWVFRGHLESKRELKFWKKEDYIDNITFLPPMDCELEYTTNNLGRGMKSLLEAGIQEADPDQPRNEETNPLRLLSSDMREEANTAFPGGLNPSLRSPLGNEAGLLLRYAYTDHIKDIFGPWWVGYYLIDLCDYYLKSFAA
jgi:hypothetical protein